LARDSGVDKDELIKHNRRMVHKPMGHRKAQNKTFDQTEEKGTSLQGGILGPGNYGPLKKKHEKNQMAKKKVSKTQGRTN